MIGRRKAQVRSLERRVTELSERVHILEQHRRVQLNRPAYLEFGHRLAEPDATPEERSAAVTEYIKAHPIVTPATPPGFLRAGWSEGTDAKPYRFGGAFPEDIADHAPANPNPYGASEDLR